MTILPGWMLSRSVSVPCSKTSGTAPLFSLSPLITWWTLRPKKLNSTGVKRVSRRTCSINFPRSVKLPFYLFDLSNSFGPKLPTEGRLQPCQQVLSVRQAEMAYTFEVIYIMFVSVSEISASLARMSHSSWPQQLLETDHSGILANRRTLPR